MACTTILVGKKASYDGSTMIARNDDSGSGHFTAKKFTVVHPEDLPKVYRSVLSHVEVPLPEGAMRFTAMPNAVEGKGIWAAAGINAANVGMTATETITSNPRVLGADPLVQGGIGEEDIVYLVLPYIHNAREGVQRLGSLLETYGTYEMNGIAFQDVDEIWWLETIGGHHWMARRVPDDSYVVMPNQLGIDAFDLDDAFGAQENHLCSADLREFITKYHLDLAQDVTNEPAENPAQPPMFCMLLRKHLTGGRLVSMQQPEMERLLDLTFDCTDEMGSPTRKHLILEIMGRNSNLILTGEDGRIVDCLRRVDFEMSEKRQVLPGLYYHLPPTQGKRDPFAVTGEELAALLSAQTAPKRLDGWLLDTFGGLSPLVCRELAFRLTGDLDTDLSGLSPEEKSALAARLSAALAQMQTAPPQPVLLYRDERPWDFTCLPVTQYGDFIRQEPYDSFSQLLDRFYAARDRADSIRQSSQAIRKTVSNLHARTARKLENQRKELAATHDRERLRQLGDILTANLYAIRRGQTKLRAADFYDPDMKEIEITLNPAISPQQNAAKFYKDYQKAKNAEKILTEQIMKGEQELAYLASVLDALTRAESARDLKEIRAELVSGGYLRETDRKKRMKLPPSRPMRFTSSDGFLIFVGRSNRQNDELTTKLAAKTDIWLHVQKIPGSHVIIETNGRTPPDRTVTEAMQLAAYYSQARDGQNVPVDYTPVKFVKKPAGAKPGMVIYTTYQTAVVTPDAALCERLKEKE